MTHKSNTEYFSLSVDTLKKDYNYQSMLRSKALSIVFDVHDKGCGNNLTKKTLGYKLKDKYYSAILSGDFFLKDKQNYIRDKLKEKTVWCFDNTELYRTKTELIKNENIPRRLVDKNIEKIKHKCYQMVTKDIEPIEPFIYNTSSSLLKNSEYYHTFEINITECNTFKDLVISNPDKVSYAPHQVLALASGVHNYLTGHNIMRYKRASSGRLVGIGGVFDAINYQTFPKALREVIYKGQYEYDICNSAPTLLSQYFNKKVNKPLPNLEKYINDKDYYRNILVKRGFTYNQAKQYLLAMTFGSKMDIDSDMYYENKDWAKETGVELVKNAVEDIELMELYLDVQEMFNTLGALIRETSKKENGKYYIYNKVNKCKVLNKWDTSKAVMHKYFGLESFILDILKDTFECNLLLYDAIITKEDLDIETLSNLVFMESDYKVQFEKIKIGEKSEKR